MQKPHAGRAWRYSTQKPLDLCKIYTIIRSMESSHLQPAARVIAICGGIEAVARLVGRDRSSVNRWLLPKESGGTGGLIPMRSAAVLLSKVSELKEQDFFATGETSDEAAA